MEVLFREEAISDRRDDKENDWTGENKAASREITVLGFIFL
jgi:hypothetical protein